MLHSACNSNQKRLGLLDAQRNATHHQGLLYRAKAQGENIENTYKPQSIMAKNNNLNAQTANTNAQTRNWDIKNQSQYQIDQANIANTYAGMRLKDSQTQLHSQHLRQQMATEDLKLKQQELAYMQQMLPNIAAGYRHTLSGNELAKFDALTPEQQQAASNAFGAQLILEALGYNMPQRPQPQQPQQPTNQHPQAFSKPTPKMLPSDDWNTFGRF